MQKRTVIKQSLEIFAIRFFLCFSKHEKQIDCFLSLDRNNKQHRLSLHTSHWTWPNVKNISGNAHYLTRLLFRTRSRTTPSFLPPHPLALFKKRIYVILLYLLVCSSKLLGEAFMREEKKCKLGLVQRNGDWLCWCELELVAFF